jgi:signal transduction histidine kinase
MNTLLNSRHSRRGSATGGEEIAEEDLPFIFEPFYQGTKARRGTRFGLGLAVMKSVIDSHG